MVSFIRHYFPLSTLFLVALDAVPKFDGLYTTALKVDFKEGRGLATSFGQIYEGMTMPSTLHLIQVFVDSIEAT